MRSTLALCLLLPSFMMLAANSVFAESYPCSPTVLHKKVIYARAEGKVTKVNFREGQVFLWDEFAAHIQPTKSPRPEMGRSYSDFAGAVTNVLVEEGQYVREGDPLYECRFLERVYTSCLVPTQRLNGEVLKDKMVKVTHGDETFDAQIVGQNTVGDRTQLFVVIFNSHEHKYWHLTFGQTVQVHL